MKRKDRVPDLDKRRVRAYLLRMAKRIESKDRPKAIGYVRVSTSKQADEGGSLEVQREAIARHAVLSGYELVDVLADGGISGSKDETDRPGLAGALEAIKTGRASVLVVTHVDRLARDTDFAGFLKTSLRRAGGRLDSIAEVKDDPIRKAVDGMLAELERIRTSQRMATWAAARTAKGLPLGRAPYGFRPGEDGRLVEVEEERPTLEKIRSLRDAGKSLRDVAEDLNGAGVPTRSGRPWNAQTIANIEKREAKK